MKRKRGFTLVELMVVIAIIALLMGLLIPALAGAMATARAKKDATNLRGIGQGMASFAGDFNGDWCIPGEVWRQAVQGPTGPVHIMGQGDPQFFLNNTADLYSCMISLKYWTPPIIVSPCENNQYIGVKGEIEENGDIVAYDYAQYDPSNGSYWARASHSGGIRCNLSSSNNSKKSHGSYTNNTLMGSRMRTWHESASSEKSVMCLRGTEEGCLSDLEEGSGEFTKSPTLDFMGPKGMWHANMLWGDISIEVILNYYPGNSRYEEITAGYSNGLKKDNVMAAEFAGAPDENNEPCHLLSGDNYCTYSSLTGDEGHCYMVQSWDSIYD